MAQREYIISMKNVEASVRMEGFAVTQQTEHDCERLMLGEVSVPELVSEILNRPKQADVCPASQ